MGGWMGAWVVQRASPFGTFHLPEDNSVARSNAPPSGLRVVSIHLKWG